MAQSTLLTDVQQAVKELQKGELDRVDGYIDGVRAARPGPSRRQRMLLALPTLAPLELAAVAAYVRDIQAKRRAEKKPA